MARIWVRLIGLGAMVLAGACASTPLPTPEPVVTAERAFAADEIPLGFKGSFLKHSAKDAVVLAPDVQNAHESLSRQPDEVLTEPRSHLVWWPLYAGIARSGDLGFTTGPYAIDDARRGHYFTIWRKDADGGWKWVFDGGVAADASAEAARDSEVVFLPTSREESPSPQAASEAVAALENELSDAAATDLRSAYGKFLDPDSRLHSAGPPPSKSKADRDAVFDARPLAATLARVGGGASAAGDLAWTYGTAKWTDEGAERAGHYARIWQKREHGWRIVFDQIVPPPRERPSQ